MSLVDNDNFIATIAGSVVGGLISVLTTFFLYRANRKDDERKELTRKYEYKGEFAACKTVKESEIVAREEAIFTDYRAKMTKHGLDFELPQKIKQKKLLKKKVIYLKNVGRSIVNQLDICVASPTSAMMVPYHHADYFVDCGLASFSISVDARIPIGGVLKLDIYYAEDSKIINMFSSSLDIVYMDALHMCYSQPLFPEESKLYEAVHIDWQEYNRRTRLPSIIGELEYLIKHPKWR